MEPGAAYVPAYAHDGDAAMDLRSTGAHVVMPGGIAAVRTGVHAEIPEGYVGLQFPRSGLGLRGINLANCVGVIDSGFRGEILAEVKNNTSEPFEIRPGDRVCQLAVVPVERCEVVLARSLADLSLSERGDRGYGSTGVA